ncbi:MAG: hypothetical protein NT127_07020, partial [Sphingobacteriales bacterium]|nr:hypothetical protein [Sphingobacteriales bacterium]
MPKSSQNCGFVRGQSAIKNHQIIYQARIVDAQENYRLVWVPTKFLVSAGQFSLKLAVDVKRACAIGLACIEVLKSDQYVGPSVASEWWIENHHRWFLRVGHFVKIFVARIPYLQVGQHAETKFAGPIVFGKVVPKGGVVPGFFGNLKRVHEIIRQILLGIE